MLGKTLHNGWGATSVHGRFERALQVGRSGGLIFVLATALPDRSPAQSPIEWRPKSAAFWATAGALVLGAAFADQRARTATLAHRSGVATGLADAGNAMGRGRNLIAVVALTYVGARLAGRRSFADGVVRVGAGYAVANAIVGIAKPLVGRHRPDSTNNAWRFAPLTTSGSRHSFPSSHAVHAFSLAAGTMIVSSRPWRSAPLFAAAGVVAWSRVYEDEHWASDVTASAVIGVASAATAIRWLDHRYPRR